VLSSCLQCIALMHWRKEELEQIPDEDDAPDSSGMTEQDWEDYTNDLENQLVDALEDKAADDQ